MLQDLQWPTLMEKRAQARVTMMYRIVHGLVDVPTTLQNFGLRLAQIRASQAGNKIRMTRLNFSRGGLA